MLKVAIIGAGNIATTAHIPYYRLFKEVEIVAICDISLEKAIKCAKENLIPYYFSNAEEMLDILMPDIVSICVPNRFHYIFTMMALERSCNVFCEKPPALTYQEALEMERKAEEKHKILFYGFQTRFTPEYEVASRIIKEDKLGRISHSKALWLRRRGIPGWGVFTNKSIQGGGPLVDIGIHMLDATLSLLDYPEVSYLSATMSDDIGKRGGEGDFGKWSGEKYSVEDSFFGFIVFKDGTSLTLETSFAINQKAKTEKNIILYGDKCGMSLFPLECFDGYEAKELKIADQDPRLGLMTNFIHSVLGLEKPIIRSSQGTYVQRIIELFYKSCESNLPVVL